MAIRKSRDEHFDVAGTVDAVFDRCVAALGKGKFSSIETNKAIHQVKAAYHKATVWGQIEITLTEKSGNTVQVGTHTTANTDNIWALFSSPIDKISNAFKTAL